MFKYGDEVDVLCMNPLAPVVRMTIAGFSVMPRRDGGTDVEFKAVYRRMGSWRNGGKSTMMVRRISDYEMRRTIFPVDGVPDDRLAEHMRDVREMVGAMGTVRGDRIAVGPLPV